jgi:hypothetical protein
VSGAPKPSKEIAVVPETPARNKRTPDRLIHEIRPCLLQHANAYEATFDLRWIAAVYRYARTSRAVYPQLCPASF